MKAFTLLLKFTITLFMAGILSSCTDKEAEYTGVLDHRPEGKDGMWVIDGTSFSVTENVELDEDAGAITVGTCVELEMEDGNVTEIESTDMSKCKAEKQ